MPNKCSTSKNKTIRRILIAEDHPFLASVLSNALCEAGYHTEIATNGKQALELIKADLERYALLITNYNMPKLTGLELSQSLRKAKFPGKIILMTLSRALHLPKGKVKEVDVFLSKTFTPEEFLGIVADLIGPA